VCRPEPLIEAIIPGKDDDAVVPLCWKLRRTSRRTAPHSPDLQVGIREGVAK
jgi:hypothetical protein